MKSALSLQLAKLPPPASRQWVPLLPYLSLVLLVGAIDYASGWVTSVIAFYPIPIVLATWRLGGGAGLVTVLFAAATWIVTNLITPDRPAEATTGYILWNAANRFAVFLAIWFLVGQMRSLLFRQSRLLSSDGLTGLESRQVFMRSAASALAAARQSGKPAALLLVDVDDLRSINGRLGQQRGDMVLLAVARSLWTGARPTEMDLVSRLGNDDFALFMPGVGAAEAQQRVAEVRQLLAENPAASTDGVTISTVLITADVAPQSFEPMLQAAEDVAVQSVIVGRASSVHRPFEPRAASA